MYISETKLRKIIRKELLKEEVTLEEPASIVSAKGGHKAGKALELGTRTIPTNAGVTMIGIPKQQAYGQNFVVVLRSKNIKYNNPKGDRYPLLIDEKDLTKYKFANKSPSGKLQYSDDIITQYAKEGRLAVVPASSLGQSHGAKELTGEDDTIGSQVATTMLDMAGLALGMTGIGEIIGTPMDLMSAELKWNRGEKAEALISVIAAAPGVGELMRGAFNSFDMLADMITSNMQVVKAAEELIEQPRIVKLIKNLGSMIGKFLDSLQDDGYLDALMESINEAIPLSEKTRKFIKNCFHLGLEPLKTKMKKLTNEIQLPNISKHIDKAVQSKQKESIQSPE